MNNQQSSYHEYNGLRTSRSRRTRLLRASEEEYNERAPISETVGINLKPYATPPTKLQNQAVLSQVFGDLCTKNEKNELPNNHSQKHNTELQSEQGEQGEIRGIPQSKENFCGAVLSKQPKADSISASDPKSTTSEPDIDISDLDDPYSPPPTKNKHILDQSLDHRPTNPPKFDLRKAIGVSNPYSAPPKVQLRIREDSEDFAPGDVIPFLPTGYLDFCPTLQNGTKHLAEAPEESKGDSLKSDNDESDDEADWEKCFGYQPAILDAMLSPDCELSLHKLYPSRYGIKLSEKNGTSKTMKKKSSEDSKLTQSSEKEIRSSISATLTRSKKSARIQMPSLQAYGIEDESTLSTAKNTPNAQKIQALQSEISNSTLAFKQEKDAEAVLTRILDLMPNDLQDPAVAQQFYAMLLDVVQAHKKHFTTPPLSALKTFCRRSEALDSSGSTVEPLHRMCNLVGWNKALLEASLASNSPQEWKSLIQSMLSGENYNAPMKYTTLELTLATKLQLLKGSRTTVWNELFQSAIEAPETTDEEKLAKYRHIAEIADDFVYAAETYGRIIISEFSLPNALKTIKPSDSGGFAGGTKFLLYGILYKVATDSENLYGDDEAAMKTCSHDLKGLTTYFQCTTSEKDSLHVPLGCVIDYRGFRLLAEAFLPLSENSLKYGSSDGGRTIMKDNKAINRRMKQAAQTLNLKGHVVWNFPDHDASHKIYAPVDIECHVGSDGRFYVLDFGRVFPAQAPCVDRNGPEYHRLLRPELVFKNPKPLSPDAFSRFGIDQREEHDLEVLQATAHLYRVVIPEFVKKWNETFIKATPGIFEEFEKNLTRYIQHEGINVRCLGILRYHALSMANEGSLPLSKILLETMVARILKNDIRRGLREQNRKLGVASNVPYIKTVRQWLNLILGKDGNHHWYWKDMKFKVESKFHKALSSHELQKDYQLRRHLNISKIVLNACHMASIVLSPEAQYELQMSTGDQFLGQGPLLLVDADIVSLECRVKHLNIVSLAAGVGLMLQAKNSLHNLDKWGHSSENIRRLFRLAFLNFEKASHASLGFLKAYREWAYGLTLQADHLTRRKKHAAAQDLLLQAAEKYEVVNRRTGDQQSKTDLGNVYIKIAEAKVCAGEDQNGLNNTLFYYQKALTHFQDETDVVSICERILETAQSKNLPWPQHRVGLHTLVEETLKGSIGAPSNSASLQTLSKCLLAKITYHLYNHFTDFKPVFHIFRKLSDYRSLIKAAQAIYHPPQLLGLKKRETAISKYQCPTSKLNDVHYALSIALFIHRLQTVSPFLYVFREPSAPFYLPDNLLTVVLSHILELTLLYTPNYNEMLYKGLALLAEVSYARVEAYLKSEINDSFLFLRDLELALSVFSKAKVKQTHYFTLVLKMIPKFYSWKIFFRNTQNPTQMEAPLLLYQSSPFHEIWDSDSNCFRQHDPLIETVVPQFNSITTMFLDKVSKKMNPDKISLVEQIVKENFESLICWTSFTSSVFFKNFLRSNLKQLAPPEKQYPIQIWEKALSFLIPGVGTINLTSPHFYHAPLLQALIQLDPSQHRTIKILSFGDISITPTSQNLEECNQLLSALIKSCVTIERLNLGGAIVTDTLLESCQELFSLEQLSLNPLIEKTNKISWEDGFLTVLYQCKKMSKVVIETQHLCGKDAIGKPIIEIWEKAIFEGSSPNNKNEITSEDAFTNFILYIQKLTPQAKNLDILSHIENEMPFGFWIPKILISSLEWQFWIKVLRMALFQDYNLVFFFIDLPSSLIKKELELKEASLLLQTATRILLKKNPPEATQHLIDEIVKRNLLSPNSDGMFGCWKDILFILLESSPDYLFSIIDQTPLFHTDTDVKPSDIAESTRFRLLSGVPAGLLQKLTPSSKCKGLVQDLSRMKKYGNWEPPLDLQALSSSLLEGKDEVLELDIQEWVKLDTKINGMIEDVQFVEEEGAKWMERLVNLLRNKNPLVKERIKEFFQAKEKLYLCVRALLKANIKITDILDGISLIELTVEDSGEKLILGDWLPQILSITPNLTSLTVFNNVDDGVLNTAISYCPLLALLDITCLNVTDATVFKIAALEHLEDFTINGPITDLHIQALIQGLPKLTILTLGSACEPYLKEEGLLKQIEKCSPLEQSELTIELADFIGVFDRVMFKTKLGTLRRSIERQGKNFPITVEWQDHQDGFIAFSNTPIPSSPK